MPVGDLVGEVLGGMVRVAGRLVFEVVVELFFAGTGHVLIRSVRPKAARGEVACGVVGIVFWAIVGLGMYALYRAASA